MVPKVFKLVRSTRAWVRLLSTNFSCHLIGYILSQVSKGYLNLNKVWGSLVSFLCLLVYCLRNGDSGYLRMKQSCSACEALFHQYSTSPFGWVQLAGSTADC